MGCTVAELSDRMQQSEYMSWRRFYQEHPWGCDIEDNRFGTLAAILVNVNGGFKGNRSAKASDFFIRTQRADEANLEADNNVLVAKMQAAFAAHNVRQSEPSD